MIALVTDQRRPVRRARPPRRVRLEPLVQRDAAQRLGLALSLLARMPDPRPLQPLPAGPEECSA